MNVPQSSTTRLQQILLSWDYWALADRTETGEGAMETLKAIPDTFASIQVQTPPLGCTRLLLLLPHV